MQEHCLNTKSNLATLLEKHKNMLTQWPKDGPMQIRMNVDMTTANTAMCWTRHIISTLEALRKKLNNKMHFTELDMHHGYMQLELDPSSRPITTFYTHWGLCWLRRPTFGINSKAEVFHNKIRQTLSHIPNVSNIYGNILIGWRNQAEHNIAPCHVLQHLVDCDLNLNLPKCFFDKSRINFFRVIFTHKGLFSPQWQSVAEVCSFLCIANFSLYYRT